MFGRLEVIRKVGSLAKNSFATVGLGSSLYGAYEYKQYRDDRYPNTIKIGNSNGGNNDEEEQLSQTRKKQVLVLPFHRIKIVEYKEPKLANTLQELLNSEESSDKLQEVELHSLIDIIHEAAADPNIVALYGTFGNGFRFQSGGYAHIEEIRNAIRVFNESHRRHEKSGITDNDTKPIRKFSYAYADTFDHPIDSGNKEYFLGTAFSQIHMQPRGNLNIFGVSASAVFLFDALEKYGIRAHVFKHGQYKNAPNTLTERGYTKPHLENTKSLIESINNTVCCSISLSRNVTDTFNSKVWQAIHNYGTLTAANAQEVHLIDHTPRIDPLNILLALNRGDMDKDSKQDFLKKWAWLDYENFQANEFISLDKYATLMSKRKKWKHTQYKRNQRIKSFTEKSSAARAMLSMIGCNAPYFNIDEKEYYSLNIDKMKNEKIAVVHVGGGIDNALSRKLVHNLRKIQKDKNIKAVILRVDSPGGSVTASETILEECRHLSIPVVCSFSNVAASGGYYISTFADKIFASPTTLTGSIGVFGVRLDLSEFAKSYGAHVNFVSSGKHSETNNLFHPLSNRMKFNFERNMDRVYDYFKHLVSEGRNIPLHEVELIAQGRVWTGEQAKEVGLVDEIGGITRAILYAKKEYTSTGEADIEFWPKPLSLMDLIWKVSEKESSTLMSTPLLGNQDDYTKLILNGCLSPLILLSHPSMSGPLLTIDEASAVQLFLSDVLQKVDDE
mmetsp:Transcript_2574/g.3059  ORF Transcript_2574/g.3059 Transcript_2574/m.3059 type:complete len:728 (-) Transcript_2574:151-2334(-)